MAGAGGLQARSERLFWFLMGLGVGCAASLSAVGVVLSLQLFS